jgi:hypothetical protein
MDVWQCYFVGSAKNFFTDQTIKSSRASSAFISPARLIHLLAGQIIIFWFRPVKLKMPFTQVRHPKRMGYRAPNAAGGFKPGRWRQ